MYFGNVGIRNIQLLISLESGFEFFFFLLNIRLEKHLLFKLLVLKPIW